VRSARIQLRRTCPTDRPRFGIIGPIHALSPLTENALIGCLVDLGGLNQIRAVKLNCPLPAGDAPSTFTISSLSESWNRY
jgi:hypothetical protein